MKSTRRCLIICCLVTSILIILVIVTLVILYFTMFKPKQPQIVATPVNLRNMEIGLSSLNISLGLDVFIRNRNYAGFKYDKTAASVYYRGVLVGLAPIEAGTIDARATENISTVVDLQVEKIITNPCFLPDVVSGSINLTSSSNLEGDVILLNNFKLHASGHVSCDISVFVMTRNSSFICTQKIRI